MTRKPHHQKDYDNGHKRIHAAILNAVYMWRYAPIRTQGILHETHTYILTVDSPFPVKVRL